MRRVYLDIAGRIPTRDEAVRFIEDGSVSKRSKLIDSLLQSDGYNSHLFNYFADMMRVADDANKVRFYTYQDWLKTQIAGNSHWDEMVHTMMTADGELLENGATGYLLRDAGMRLDNMSLTLSTFLGANVSCAQCHDHPFAEWTQREFYEMAAFFGATETYGAKGSKSGGKAKAMKRAVSSLDSKRLQAQAKNILRVNMMEVEDTGSNTLKLPDDYKYDDGAPGDRVEPKLIGCLLARRLVENGIRYVEVAASGWDVHTGIAERMEELGTELDTALAALIGDLDDRSPWPTKASR